MKIGRNDPCHCGSGKKYKKCHAELDDAQESAELAAAHKKALEAKEAEEAEAAAKPDADKAGKGTAGRPAPAAAPAAKPKERIATAANPIRRRAV